MTTTESEAVLTQVINDTWTTPDQKRIKGFLATAAIKLNNELAEIDL